MRAWIGTLCCLVSMTSAASAQEDADLRDAEARSLYEAGSSAFSAGRFDDALTHFEAAYELSPRPQLLYNIGASADRLRQNDKALDAFERYLAAVPDAENRAHVEARMTVLRASIERETRLEQDLATAAAELGDKKRRRRWIGAVSGAVAAVVLAVVVGVLVAREDPAPYEQGTFGVVFPLRGGP